MHPSKRDWSKAAVGQKTNHHLHHPKYSPDLAPSDFPLFARLKIVMMGNLSLIFKTNQGLSYEGAKSFKEEEFDECFREWQGQMH